MLPRAVLVERPTEYRDLLARHGTREQVRFFLQARGISLTDVEARHLTYEETRASVLAAIPADWRRSVVDRAELDRFLFAADDVVIALGQDGLVANVAKYLDGQPVIGLNPDPARNAGVLVRHAPAAAADLLRDIAAGRAVLQRRTMAEGRLDDGQRLLALNELFVGHVSRRRG
jgi:NAD kinase